MRRGAGVFIYDCTPLLENNTITQNHCTEGSGGGVYTNDGGSCRGANNILFDNTGLFGAQWYGNLDLTYSCSSDPLPGTGNISADPLFVDPLQQDFHLQAGSPCIDSGDPTAPLDPDSTRADMGALYFDQGIQPSLQIALTPFGIPIVIPPQGGRFAYDVQVSNDNTQPETTDVWMSVTLPGGSQLGPIVGPVQLSLPPLSVMTRSRIQSVPANAPEGIYWYRASIGTYPGIVADSDSFLFAKSGAVTTAAPALGGWSDLGEDFTAGEGQSIEQAGAFSVKSSPNPFNQSCTVLFHLPEAAEVCLSLYDPAGRREAELFSGRLNAGAQRLHIDGGKLNSGVHLYRLRVGERVAWGKIVLLK